MYKTITENTLQVLAALPVTVPAEGSLAGFAGEYMVPDQPMFMGDNYHYPMGTAYLKFGVVGVSRRAAASAKNVTDDRNRELLEGIAQVYEAIAAWIARYADAVDAAAGEDTRLKRMGENLHRLAKGAPVHFHEALQLTYLMWKIRCLNKPGADIGRLDVHLRSFFEADIASGYTTEDEVLEQLVDFWNLLNKNDSGDTLINVMVGGRNPDGSDAGSRLSVLMLEATKRCKKSEPHINVRVHPSLRPDIYRAMLEVQLMGQGQATVYNDEVIIPSLINFGIPEELACCYTNDGCTEIMLDGYSGIDFAHVDAVATFELAFNNGDWAERTYRKPVSYFHKDGKGDIRTFLDRYLYDLAQIEEAGDIGLITGNHDMQRLAYGRTPEEVKCALVFLFTMKGVPFVYYGDEIGMDYIPGLPSKEGGYIRTGSRTPMQWNGNKNHGFSLTMTLLKSFLNE